MPTRRGDRVKSALRKLLNQAPANPPVPYAARSKWGLPLSMARADNNTYERAFASSGGVYAIVTLLARSSAKAEWRLYRKTQDGRVRYTTRDAGSDQRTEVVQHQALKVLHKPNPFMFRHDLMYMTQQWLELTGEAYWLVVKAGDIPTGLWPVNPARMTPVPSPVNFLSGWVYESPDGQQIPLQVDEVIQTKYPNPLDIYRGLGPVQAVLVDIDASRYSSEWNRNFFINSAQPNGIVTVPNTLNDAEFNELSDRWREAHQGVSRAHRVAFLEGGAQWVQTQPSMRDMDFSNLRNLSRDVIREAWGIHKVMVGVSDDVNRANAQTGEEVHAAWQVLPRMDLIKNTLNYRFLPMFGATGENVEFDFSGVDVQNREQDNAEMMTRAQAVQFLVSAGASLESSAKWAGVDVEAATVASTPASLAAQPPTQQDDSQAELENRLRKVLLNGHLPVPIPISTGGV